MAWTDLLSNQTISFNNLKNAVDNGIFTAKTTIPISNEQITKADANAYVFVNTENADFASKANNQLVVKSNLLSNFVIYSAGNPTDGSFALIRSTDLGFTWSKVDQVTGGDFIQCVSASNNGIYVLAGRSMYEQPGSGRLSQTSGNTWLDMTAVVPTTDGITSCIVSGSGQYMIITRSQESTFNNQIIYTSSDYGSSFAATRNDDGNSLDWQAAGISMSDSGQYITIAVPSVLTSNGGYRIRSTNYGATWLSAVSYGAHTITTSASAMSSSGQYQILGFNGQISLSSSFGNTWSFIGPSGFWTNMAVSESGQYMLAMRYINVAPFAGELYRSSNYGQSWTLANTFTYTGSVKFAPNEKTAFLAISGGYFYISNDYGATWSVQVNAPLAPVARNYRELAIASIAPLSGSVTYSTNSGLYPVTGSTLTTASITITNGLSSTIYLWGSFNSGGANSGNISGDKLTSAGYPDINMSGTVSSFGQTIYSSTAWELPTGASIVLTVTKNDGIGSGSTMRVAYSNTVGGGKTNI
jgi:hypothetical protein